MRYLKSLLAGLFAVVGVFFSLLLVLVVSMVVYNVLRPPAVGTRGWDPISPIPHEPLAWLAAAILFCGGFFWKFRKLAR